MAILRSRQVWTRKPKPNSAGALDDAKRENVRRALMRLRLEYGAWARVARALRMKQDTLTKAIRRAQRMPAGIEFRVAYMFGVDVDVILSGEFLRRGVCPVCGRFESLGRRLRVWVGRR